MHWCPETHNGRGLVRLSSCVTPGALTQKLSEVQVGSVAGFVEETAASFDLGTHKQFVDWGYWLLLPSFPEMASHFVVLNVVSMSLSSTQQSACSPASVKQSHVAFS